MTVDAGMERFMREPGELYLRQIAVHQEAGKKLEAVMNFWNGKLWECRGNHTQVM
jgi:hypothetical protein